MRRYFLIPCMFAVMAGACGFVPAETFVDTETGGVALIRADSPVSDFTSPERYDKLSQGGGLVTEEKYSEAVNAFSQIIQAESSDVEVIDEAWFGIAGSLDKLADMNASTGQDDLALLCSKFSLLCLNNIPRGETVDVSALRSKIIGTYPDLEELQDTEIDPGFSEKFLMRVNQVAGIAEQGQSGSVDPEEIGMDGLALREWEYPVMEGATGYDPHGSWGSTWQRDGEIDLTGCEYLKVELYGESNENEEIKFVLQILGSGQDANMPENLSREYVFEPDENNEQVLIVPLSEFGPGIEELGDNVQRVVVHYGQVYWDIPLNDYAPDSYLLYIRDISGIDQDEEVNVLTEILMSLIKI